MGRISFDQAHIGPQMDPRKRGVYKGVQERIASVVECTDIFCMENSSFV
jgi:hypothetical protein